MWCWIGGTGSCRKATSGSWIVCMWVISNLWVSLRYNTDNIKERVVEGKLGYLAQSQLERARLRRPPQSMMSIKQEFDKDRFNFNKIDESKELVCQLVNTDRESKQVERDILIINVSPIDRGHCLLVPQVEAGLQQVCCHEGVGGAPHLSQAVRCHQPCFMS